MAKVTADELKKLGTRFWVLDEVDEYPIEVEVSRGLYTSHGHILNVEVLVVDTGVKMVLCPRDLGIRPINYDNRPTQAFTTKEEIDEAVKSWAGVNPNFLEGD